MVMGLCTIVCGGDDFTDMENFGREQEEVAERFFEAAQREPGFGYLPKNV